MSGPDIYPEREIFAYGRYIQCQILNWSEGQPPRYLICNPLHKDYREEFLAHQAMGTWARCELREAAAELSALRERCERAERERVDAVRNADKVCDSYVAENQRLFDRAEAAEAARDEAVAALERMEQNTVALYNSISPHAEYLIDGKSGNRFADKDPAVLAARSLTQPGLKEKGNGND